jgi:uncharacterized protein YbjT (DUF2867 family)
MIVVTAPTSGIGRQVVQNLLASGATVRVVARDPARLAPGVAERAEVVRGSHSDPSVVAEAFAGADAVFWLVPADPKAGSVIEAYVDFSRPGAAAFKTESVGRVVGISALGRGTPVAGQAGLVTGSLAMDDLITEAGVPFRALCMPSFMDNLLRQAGPIKNQGVFRGPVRPGLAAPAVATRDIAATAAQLLQDSSWTGAAEVPLLGPEDLSQQDMATIMSDVLGKPVRYQQTPAQAYKDNFLSFGYSEPMAQGMLDMALAKDKGLDNGVARTPALSTPTTFRQWCTDVLKPAVDA